MNKPPPPPRPPVEVQPGEIPVWLEDFLVTPFGLVAIGLYAAALAWGLWVLTGLIAGVL